MTTAAWAFHDRTKYRFAGDPAPDAATYMGDPAEGQATIGPQDPANEPLGYKIYSSLPAIALPRPAADLPMPALLALAADGLEPLGERTPTIDDLARLLLRTNGILKTWQSPGGRLIEFRAAGCTGARYHVELYVVAGEMPGLAAGIYHYAAHDHTLRQLRVGDFRGALVAATAAETAVAAAPLTIVATSTFWRNAWRYKERAYRHVFWDTGTQLANLLAVSAAAAIPARTVLGFVDAEVNALLDVDGEREAAIALVALGRVSAPPPPSPPVSPLNHSVVPVSASEIPYPEIQAMHHASALRSSAEVAGWRAGREFTRTPPPRGRHIPLSPLLSAALPSTSIEAVIAGRRSYRKYNTTSKLDFAAFSTVLTSSPPRSDFDCLPPGSPALVTRSLLVNRVTGVPAGIFRVTDAADALIEIRQAEVSELAYQLAYYQAYAGEAHVNVYETTDLASALERFGNRGYRVAQLVAAIAGARMQLAAHAFTFGAVGSTSLDDLVTDALSAAGEAQAFMFVAVFGERRRKTAALASA